MCYLKPAEYLLAQPYRLKIGRAESGTSLADALKNGPDEKFQQERLRLLDGLHPKGEPHAGDLLKTIE